MDGKIKKLVGCLKEAPRIPLHRVVILEFNRRYVEGLEGTPVTALGRDAQLAFWINLYNAATVRLIVDHYPVASILDIRVGESCLDRSRLLARGSSTG